MSNYVVKFSLKETFIGLRAVPPFRRSSPRESKKISEKKGPAWNSAGERGAFLPEFPGTHKPPLFFVDLTLASRDGLRR